MKTAGLVQHIKINFSFVAMTLHEVDQQPIVAFGLDRQYVEADSVPGDCLEYFRIGSL